MNFRHLTASVTSVAGLVIVAQSRLQIQLELSLSMLITRHSLQLWGYAESQNARGSVTATGPQSPVESPRNHPATQGHPKTFHRVNFVEFDMRFYLSQGSSYFPKWKMSSQALSKYIMKLYCR